MTPLDSMPPLPPNRSIPPSTVIPVLAYADVRGAVAWLGRAFGFTERLQIADHRSQLAFGDGALVVAERGVGAAASDARQPASLATTGATRTSIRGPGAALRAGERGVRSYRHGDTRARRLAAVEGSWFSRLPRVGRIGLAEVGATTSQSRRGLYLRGVGLAGRSRDRDPVRKLQQWREQVAVHHSLLRQTADTAADH